MRERTPGRGWRGVKVLLVAGIAASTGGCVLLDDIMGDVFGRSMRDQPSLDAYDDPRPPPEGAVPFASPNFPAEPGGSGIGMPAPYEYDMPAPIQPIDVLQETDAVMDLENPVDPTSESLERGEEMFNVYCAPCHAVEGDGAGPVTLEHVQPGITPISLITEGAAEHPDGYLYSIQRVGRGAMPAYGHQLDHFDRWHVVNYVRQLQEEALGEEMPNPGAGANGGADGDDVGGGNGEEG